MSRLIHLNSHQALLSPPGLHLIGVQLLCNLQRAQGLHVHHQALLQGGAHHAQPRVLQDQQCQRLLKNYEYSWSTHCLFIASHALSINSNSAPDVSDPE